jgi:hypothetical protein
MHGLMSIKFFWWNFSVASNMKIPSAVLQFVTAERQKVMTNLNGALLQRVVMKETETTTELPS